MNTLIELQSCAFRADQIAGIAMDEKNNRITIYPNSGFDSDSSFWLNYEDPEAMRIEYRDAVCILGRQSKISVNK